MKWQPADFQKRHTFALPESARRMLLNRLGDTEENRTLLAWAEAAVSRHQVLEASRHDAPPHNKLLTQAQRIARKALELAEAMEAAPPALWSMARQAWALEETDSSDRPLRPPPEYLDPEQMSLALRDLDTVLSNRLPLHFPRESAGIKADVRHLVAMLADAYHRATGKLPGRSRKSHFSALVVVTFDALGRFRPPLKGAKDMEHRADAILTTIKAGVALWEEARDPGGKNKGGSACISPPLG